MVRSVRSREAGPLGDRDVVAVGASKFLLAGIDHDLGFSHMAVAPTKGERRPNMTTSAMSDYDDIHANSLLASTFSHLREVLADPVLYVLQKRCILATWASDAFAVEGKPWVRQIPATIVKCASATSSRLCGPSTEVTALRRAAARSISPESERSARRPTNRRPPVTFGQ